MRYTILIIVFLSIFSRSSEVPEAIQIAQKASLDNGKLILIYLGTDWCGGCIDFKKEYTRNESLRHFIKEHVNFVEVDGDSKDGKWVSRNYGEFGYPSFYFVDAALNKQYGMIGYYEAEFTTIVKDVISKKSPVHRALSQFKEEPLPFFAAEVAEWYVRENDFEKAIQWYEKAEQLNFPLDQEFLSDPTTSYTYDIVFCKGRLLHKGKIEFPEFRKAVDRALAFEHILPSQELSLISRVYWQTFETEGYRKIIAPYFDRLSNIDPADFTEPQLRRYHDMTIQKLLFENRIPEALKLKFESMPTDWKENPRKLLQFLEWCARNHVPFDEAAALGQFAHDKYYDNKYYPEILPYSSISIVISKGPEEGFLFFEAHLGKAYKSNANAYNTIAWWCAKNKRHLNYAEKHAQKGVHVASNPTQKAQVLDTLAAIEFGLGKSDLAIAHMREAAALAPNDQHYKRQLEVYLKGR